jgi:predicted DNA-binding WGR domain protein
VIYFSRESESSSPRQQTSKRRSLLEQPLAKSASLLQEQLPLACPTKFKPLSSRARMDPACGLPQDSWHVLDESVAFAAAAIASSPPCSPLVEDCTEQRFPLNLWDTSLCMSNLSTGVNSQYKLQILVSDDVNNNTNHNVCAHHLWRVWGRVGGAGGGGSKLQRFGSVEEAKKEFAMLFKKQTGNEWLDRAHNFEKKAGKFAQLDIQYEDAAAANSGDNNDKKIAATIRAGDANSKLDARVQEVITLMFDPAIGKSANCCFFSFCLSF